MSDDEQERFRLGAFKKSIYAQGAEEDILQRIFARIEPATRVCIDIGASDGLRNSNTALLWKEHGWRAVLVEGDAYRFGRMRDNAAAERWDEARVTMVHARVQPDTVDDTLAGAGVPAAFDLLSLDVDGNDWWIWRALERHRPRVVVVEYNPYYEPPERWVMKLNPDHVWDGSTYYGASLASFAALGADKGYELLCCDQNGNNAFFVERELFARFGVDDNSPQALYRPAMYKVRFVGKNTFVTGHPYRWGPGEPL